ncbi:hypothetical protein KN815_12165 [Streptomyces sp. 4503]|uniref:Integral membrane protein n=1 Tax=Streptomyces niphimycinicus TaxID=2842201 RepID=A0ABS6CD47_9ACTN|nr:hypothetical protein [Streptomyces niphimycinicus]MBU3864808.1 hypothetical protein [Streptomyces niphimycinicus]
MTSQQHRLGQDDPEQSGSEVAPRTWPREEDARWAGRFRLRLILRHDPPDGLGDQVVDEVYEAVTDSGRSAHELFGDADDFAAQVAAERIDDAHRSHRDMHGVTPGEGFRGGLLRLGAVGVLLSLYGWFSSGLEFTIGWRELVGIPLIGTVPLLGVVALTLRTAGRPRGAWTAIVGAVVMVPVAALAIGSLPDGPLFSAPAPAVVALSALPAVIGWLLPEERVSRWFNGPEAAHHDDEAWLRRLDGVLRGAHGLSPKQAQTHVEEARAHLAASGGEAHEQFGTPQVYALRLADGPGASRRAARRELRSGLLFLPILAITLSEVIDDPDPGSPFTWVLPPAALLWAWSLWGQYRDTRSP